MGLSRKGKWWRGIRVRVVVVKHFLTTMSEDFLHLPKYDDSGNRTVGQVINKHRIGSFSHKPNPILIAPKDPSDPSGKTKLDVPDSEKKSMMLIQFFAVNPPMKPNYKGDGEEEVPFCMLWIPTEHFEKEWNLLLKHFKSK